MSKAEDILFVLNHLQPINLTELKFTVIVHASNDRGHCPFEKGEIIINDGWAGREPFSDRRKPGKWDVTEESFDTLIEAMDCRRKVLAGDWPT